MAILAPNKYSGSHWYRQDGSPCHQVPRAKGDGTRATTVRDARTMGLLPSVTNILGAIAKPQLETWKIQQGILAAMASPQTDTESEEYYIRRVIEASKETVTQAADLGSAIHDALESAGNGDPVPDKYVEYVDPALEWIADQMWEIEGREKMLVNLRDGYAGTADVLFRWGLGNSGVLDYKTRRTKPGQKVTPFDGQGEQLAAYAVAAYGESCLKKVRLINMYISTTEPGRMEIYEHENADELWEVFRAAATIWRKQKKYDPRVAWEILGENAKDHTSAPTTGAANTESQ